MIEADQFTNQLQWLDLTILTLGFWAIITNHMVENSSWIWWQNILHIYTRSPILLSHRTENRFLEKITDEARSVLQKSLKKSLNKLIRLLASRYLRVIIALVFDKCRIIFTKPSTPWVLCVWHNNWSLSEDIQVNLCSPPLAGDNNSAILIIF